MWDKRLGSADTWLILYSWPKEVIGFNVVRCVSCGIRYENSKTEDNKIKKKIKGMKTKFSFLFF